DRGWYKLSKPPCSKWSGRNTHPSHPLLSFLAPATNWCSAVIRYKNSANSNAFGCNILCPAVCARGALHGSYLGIGVRLSPKQVQEQPRRHCPACARATCIHHFLSSLPAVSCCASRLAVKRLALFLSLTHSISNHYPALPCPAPLSSGYHRIPVFSISPRKTPSAPLLPFLSFCRYPRRGPLIPAAYVVVPVPTRSPAGYVPN
ncbi:hypothetical protein PspLS_09488, partial [Pyricularia sp. CBS 133598]